MLIDVSGTARQVRDAFSPQRVRYLDVNGAPHVANVSDPLIPAALAPVVSGIRSSMRFPAAFDEALAHANFARLRKFYRLGARAADLAAIYDLNPLFASGISGQGQTVAVMRGQRSL